MPLILESHDSLPYIDGDLTPSTRASIAALISAELPPSHTQALHPSVPSAYTPAFSPAMQQEHQRISSHPTRALAAIDLARYEAVEAPAGTSPRSDEERAETAERWRGALRRAYASAAFLAARHRALALLEAYGRNAWLVGNAQLEDELRAVEAELAAARRRVEEVEGLRRALQEGVGGEMAALEESWRRGVGRVIEVEVAAEGLRREALESRRRGAV